MSCFRPGQHILARNPEFSTRKRFWPPVEAQQVLPIVYPRRRRLAVDDVHIGASVGVLVDGEPESPIGGGDEFTADGGHSGEASDDSSGVESWRAAFKDSSFADVWELSDAKSSGGDTEGCGSHPDPLAHEPPPPHPLTPPLSEGPVDGVALAVADAPLLGERLGRRENRGAFPKIMHSNLGGRRNSYIRLSQTHGCDLVRHARCLQQTY